MTYGTTFAKVYAQKKGKGKISLRRSLYARALSEDGPPAIAIFVAKNHLGMADKVEHVTPPSEQESAPVAAMTKEEAQRLLDERCKVVPPKP